MAKFSGPLTLTTINDDTWRVETEFTFFSDKYEPVTVPVGYQTDLASVPRYLWSIFPPFGRYSQAAVTHDFIYQMRKDLTYQGTERSRKECDEIFLEAMKTLKVPWWKRQLMYRAVRSFGWAH